MGSYYNDGSDISICVSIKCELVHILTNVPVDSAFIAWHVITSVSHNKIIPHNFFMQGESGTN